MSTFLQELETELLKIYPEPIKGKHKDQTLSGQINFELILRFEDFLNGREVFTNMFDGRRTSADSYGTIFGYDTFDKALKDFNIDRLYYHQWRRITGYYRNTSYMSPTLGILSAQIARTIGLPYPLTKNEATNAFYEASELEFPIAPAT
jgi:hypothetical protein